MIFNIMRFATHDGPGIRTTIFFKGCPLACWWCHNPESRSFQPDRLYFEERCRHCGDCIAACPQHAIEETDGVIRTSSACIRCGHCAEVCAAEARRIAGRRYGLPELLNEIEQDLVFFEESRGGVTLSGGEPLAQPQFAAALLRTCRERGLQTAIETCGFTNTDTFLSVALLADLVFFDLKLVDEAKHRRHTGVSNGAILRNLEELLARGRAVVVRIPVVPGVNDSDDDAAQFAAWLARVRAPRVELLPYHRIGADKYRRLGLEYGHDETAPPRPEDLARFRDTLARAGLSVTIGG